MQKKKLFSALMVGLLSMGLITGCGDDKKPAAKPTPTVVKLNLPWEKVPLAGGKEIEIAKLNNANKLSLTKSWANAGAMTKIGDKLYLRNSNNKTIIEAKLEGNDIKVTKTDFVKDVDEKAFLSNDGSKLYYSSKFKILAATADGKTNEAYNRFVSGVVCIPDTTDGLIFINSNPVKRVDLSTGKVGKEMGIVIPEMKTRKTLATPNGLACDGTNAYLFGSTLDDKMSVGAVAVYGLDGKQKFILGAKNDKDRKPGFLASAGDIAVTKDYIFVMDINIRQLNIFNKKTGKIVDLGKADKLFKGYRAINLLPYSDNNVLVVAKPAKANEPDMMFMLNL